MSSFRDRCIGRKGLVGTFAAIPHPVAVEITAQSGFDFLCIDWEHAQISRDMIENSGARVRCPPGAGHGAGARP